MRIKFNAFYWVFFLMILVSGNVCSQQNFGIKCVGNWKGTMHIYNQGILTDSVPVILEVRQQDDSVCRWKMHYLESHQQRLSFGL